MTCDDLVRALNARLPRDIRVRQAEDAFDGFDARHDAVTKTYRYADLERRRAKPVPQARRLARHAAAGRAGHGRRRPRARRRVTISRRSRAQGATPRRRRGVCSQSDLREVALDDEDAIGIAAVDHPSPRLRSAPSPLRSDRHRLPPPHGPGHRRHARRHRPRPNPGRRDERLSSSLAIAPEPG